MLSERLLSARVLVLEKAYQMKDPIFDHERLDAYRLAISLDDEECRAQGQWPRAAQSLPLHISEGNEYKVTVMTYDAVVDQ